MSEHTASKEQLRAKAAGMFSGIHALRKRTLERAPSLQFGSDFNALRKAVAASYPDIAPLLPPEVPIRDGSTGQYVASTYGEILSYVTQIVNLLEKDDPSEASTSG